MPTIQYSSPLIKCFLRVTNMQRLTYKLSVNITEKHKERMQIWCAADVYSRWEVCISVNTTIYYSFHLTQIIDYWATTLYFTDLLQVHYLTNQQPGPIYFLTPWKCTIFSVTCEDLLRQVTFFCNLVQPLGKDILRQAPLCVCMYELCVYRWVKLLGVSNIA